MAMIDKNEFITNLETGIRQCMNDLDEVEKDYTRDKGNKIIDMLIELENGNLLKTLNNTEANNIRQELNNPIKNFEYIRNLYLSCHDLVKNSQISSSNEIKLKDVLGNEYVINGNQIVNIFAWTYCSLCEVIREHLMLIIDLTQLSGREPTGLGSLIQSLRNKGVTNLSFFDDIDIPVRNSFFHLKFKIDNNRIYCKHKPNVYVNNSWGNRCR